MFGKEYLFTFIVEIMPWLLPFLPIFFCLLLFIHKPHIPVGGFGNNEIKIVFHDSLQQVVHGKIIAMIALLFAIIFFFYQNKEIFVYAKIPFRKKKIALVK
jgi:hypothetical protein